MAIFAQASGEIRKEITAVFNLRIRLEQKHLGRFELRNVGKVGTSRLPGRRGDVTW